MIGGNKTKERNCKYIKNLPLMIGGNKTNERNCKYVLTLPLIQGERPMVSKVEPISFRLLHSWFCFTKFLFTKGDLIIYKKYYSSSHFIVLLWAPRFFYLILTRSLTLKLKTFLIDALIQY